MSHVQKVQSTFDLYTWIIQHIGWSSRTFGLDQRTEGLCKHIEKECNEVRQSPNDLYEAIDILILGFDLAWRMGYTAQEIIEALDEKQRINFERQWQRTPADTPTEHVR